MSTYYTSKYSGEEIDARLDAMSVIAGANTSQQLLNQLGAGVRPNLLINPFFQVNQRGQTSYSGTYGVYTVDGWLLNNAETATVNVLSNGVHIYCCCFSIVNVHPIG